MNYITDQHLAVCALHIPPDKFLSFIRSELGVDQYIIDRVSTANGGDYEKNFFILNKWKETLSKPTVENLRTLIRESEDFIDQKIIDTLKLDDFNESDGKFYAYTHIPYISTIC